MSEIKLTFRCDGCDAIVSFPSTEAGTVQDCPECGGWVDVPEVTRREKAPPWKNLHDELNARYFEENVRHQVEIGRQIEVAWDQLKRAGERHEREASLVAREEEGLDRALRLLERFERLADRFEALLARWERPS